MSDLLPLLGELNTLINKIEVQLSKGQHTKEEANILRNSIQRGLPMLGIEPSIHQWINLVYPDAKTTGT